MSEHKAVQELQMRLERKQAEIEQLEIDSDCDPGVVAQKAVECRDLAVHLADLCPDKAKSYEKLALYFETLKRSRLNSWERAARHELPKRSFWLCVRGWFDQIIHPKPWPKDGSWNPALHERWGWCSRHRAAAIRDNTLEKIEGLRKL